MAKIVKLANGITCIIEERPGSGAVTTHMRIAQGTFADAPQDTNLTALTEEVMSAGTTTRDTKEISKAIDSKGAAFSSGVSSDATYFTLKCRTQDTSGLFDVLADIVRNLSFETKELERLRKIIIEGIEQKEEKPAYAATRGFYEMAFGENTTKTLMGDKTAYSKYARADLQRKHAELMADPKRIIISFAGDITEAQAQNLAEKYFGDMQAPAPKAENAKLEPQFIGGDHRKETDNKQLNLFFGFKSPSRGDERDENTLRMLNEILSGMSSPLFQEIREKRGLVYSVGASYTAYKTAGAFYISAGTGPGNAGELISVTLELLGEIARNGVTQETLDQARGRLLRQMLSQEESAADVCVNNAAKMEKRNFILSLQQCDELLKKVTSDDIRRVLGQMLQSGKYALSAIGPQKGMPMPEEIRALIQKQAHGLVVPVKDPVKDTIQPLFNSLSAKTEKSANNPKITVLPNGLTVITLERPGTLSCGAWVGAGSDHETPELNGATHMNEHMMFKGTPSYKAGEIDRIVEKDLMGDLNAYTSNDMTAYYFYNLAPEALEKVTDICGEMVFYANLDHDEFNGKNGAKGERDVVIEEILRSYDNANGQIYQKMCETAYAGQAHSRPILGTEETLRQMTVEKLAAYRDLYYAPNNVVFSAAGPVRHEDFVACVQKRFGNLQPKNFSPLPQQDWKGGTVAIDVPKAPWSTVLIATPGTSSTDPKHFAHEALSIILGGGESSRLYEDLVLNKDVTPGVSTYASSHANVGTFIISAYATPEKIKPFIAAAYSNLKESLASLTEEELEKAKITMEMDLLSTKETNAAACDEQAISALQNKRVITVEETLRRIRALSLQDVKKALQDILAANPTVTIGAPKGMDKTLLPTHSEVLAMRDGKKPPTPKPPPTLVA